MDATELKAMQAPLKQAYRENPQRTYATYGPKTRREFVNLLRSHDGRPA